LLQSKTVQKPFFRSLLDRNFVKILPTRKSIDTCLIAESATGGSKIRSPFLMRLRISRRDSTMFDKRGTFGFERTAMGRDAPNSQYYRITLNMKDVYPNKFFIADFRFVNEA
jgi:hypothetical protein